MITLKKLKDNPEALEELGGEFSLNEKRINNRNIFMNGRFYMPGPWLDAMKKVPELVGLAERFSYIGPEVLAPMTVRMKELCDVLGLPHYETPLDEAYEEERQKLIKEMTDE